MIKIHLERTENKVKKSNIVYYLVIRTKGAKMCNFYAQFVKKLSKTHVHVSSLTKKISLLSN